MANIKKWLRQGIPVMLTILFCVISVISLATISHMQGNARVINYTGIVRGATQRLIKQEMNGSPNDDLIPYLDGILSELSTGQGENGLVALPDAEFQGLLAKMRRSWDEIKAEIAQVRDGADGQRLFALSESYFELADQTVSAAERYSEKQVGHAQTVLIFLTASFIVSAAVFWLYSRRQIKVQAALDVAEHASRAKSQFLSRMSHEIRTPLSGIIGMTDIAKMAPNDPQRQQDCLNKIELSSRYLLSLINDILDMSRIESGKIELEEEPFDVKELFAQIHGMFQQKAEDANIFFQANCDGLSATMVAGDKVRLTQVLVNMVSNALKFTPAGGRVTLEARQKVVSEQAVSLEFLVADTGIGISEEFQARIFEPFEQEAAATGRQYGGTGLGLAISSSFVKMMGGAISVHSKPGEGTRFTVALTLPRPSKEEAGFKNPGPDASLPGDGEKPYDLTRARVLLAEDNEINAEIVTVILEGYGAQVERAHDGREAVAMFQAAPGAYTLILMDIQMPLMDGLEASRAIRNHQKDDGKAVPIIGLSANAFREDVDKAIQSGMNGYLSKPIDKTKLLETVRRFL